MQPTRIFRENRKNRNLWIMTGSAAFPWRQILRWIAAQVNGCPVHDADAILSNSQRIILKIKAVGQQTMMMKLNIYRIFSGRGGGYPKCVPVICTIRVYLSKTVHWGSKTTLWPPKIKFTSCLSSRCWR